MVQFILGIYLGMNILATIIYYREDNINNIKKKYLDIVVLLLAGSLFYFSN